MRRVLLVLGTLLLSSLGWAQGRIDHVVMHSTALEGNLIGDSAERDVYVYLPPSYDSSDKRYPVVFLLHGYGLRAERWITFAQVEAGANAAIDAGAQEMIIVNPNAYNFFDGSMYTSSITTGDWERFIAEELVDYIDTNYRTLANRASRGLAGHSMGGYGTLRLGMKYPQVFSALYPMSACCLMDAAAPSENFALAATYDSREAVDALRYPAKSTLARAAAWSPNPDKPPLYLDLPSDATATDPELQAKWLANSLGALLDQYTFNLRRYTAIQMDVGDQDSLITTNQGLSEKFDTAGIKHTFLVYEGDHNNRVPDRVRDHVLPFFSRHLQGQR